MLVLVLVQLQQVLTVQQCHCENVEQQCAESTACNTNYDFGQKQGLNDCFSDAANHWQLLGSC
jgi:hypothetical protein